MRPLDLATLAYLALGLAVLAINRPPPAWLALAVAHLAAIAMILWRCLSASRTSSGLREWYPLLLVPLFYAELPILNERFLSASRDASVLWLERVLFPFEPARTFAAAVPWRPFSETLHFAYLSYYPIIYGPLLLLFVRGKQAAFRETAFAIALTYYCCYAIYVLFPVRGPWDLWPVSDAPPDGPLRRLTVQILEAGSSRGAAFPSSHQAVAVAQTACAMRHLPRLAPVIALLSAGIAAGAVYASFHYAVDMILGAALGAAVAAGTHRWLRERSHTSAPR